MQIAEPVTVLTDYMLAGLCVWLGARLTRVAQEAQALSMRLFALSFFTTALAALAGGTTHLFRPTAWPLVDTVLWKITVYAIGVTALLFLATAAHASLRSGLRRFLLVAAALQLGAYALWMVFHDDFAYVIYDYVPAMLLVLAIQLFDWRRSPDSAPWIALGILISLAGAAIQQSGITLHRYFNHNDLYHVAQMVGMLALYRGGSAMRDRAE